MARAGGLRPVRTRAPDGNTPKSRRELSVSGGRGGQENEIRVLSGCGRRAEIPVLVPEDSHCCPGLVLGSLVACENGDIPEGRHWRPWRRSRVSSPD